MTADHHIREVHAVLTKRIEDFSFMMGYVLMSSDQLPWQLSFVLTPLDWELITIRCSIPRLCALSTFIKLVEAMHKILRFNLARSDYHHCLSKRLLDVQLLDL